MPALSLLIVLLPAAGPLPDDTPSQKVSKAHESFREFKYDDAIKVLDKVIKNDAKFARAYQERGCARFMKGDFAGACADFDQFNKLEPKFANTNWQRGIALYYLG